MADVNAPDYNVEGTGLTAAGIGGGDLFSGITSLVGGLINNQANRRQAAKAMEFSERMSNTAHQREVRDLKLAGLNPILSGMGGSGASSAQGIAAQQQDVLTPALNSALSSREKRMQARQVEVNTLLGEAQNVGQEHTNKLINDQREKTQAETKTQEVLQQSQAAQMANNIASAQESQQRRATEAYNTVRMQHEATIALTNALKAANMGDVEKGPMGKYLPYLDRLIQSATGVTSAVRNVVQPWDRQQKP